MNNINNNLGKLLKLRRDMASMTLQDLATVSQVSISHLGRIERGERFPSARVLKRLASPLQLDELELLSFAGYLSHHANNMSENSAIFKIDPYLATVLGQEPVEIQRSILTLLNIVKNMVKDLPESLLGNTQTPRDSLKGGSFIEHIEAANKNPAEASATTYPNAGKGRHYYVNNKA